MPSGGRKQKRFSSEYTILSILEYLYLFARNTPVSKHKIVTTVSKHKIVTNAAGIRQQRPDRVNNIMQILEQNGFIRSIKASS